MGKNKDKEPEVVKNVGVHTLGCMVTFTHETTGEQFQAHLEFKVWECDPATGKPKSEGKDIKTIEAARWLLQTADGLADQYGL